MQFFPCRPDRATEPIPIAYNQIVSAMRTALKHGETLFDALVLRYAVRYSIVFFSVLLTVSSATKPTTLTVKILDESGFPTTARVYLTDEKGKSYFPTGALVYKRMNWNVSEEHFFPPDGSFSIELQKNTYSLRIERGKEYLPIHDDIVLSDSGNVEKIYRLQRWMNMANKGWYSADMHAHVSLRNVAMLLNGEDLNVLLPITMWRVSFVPAYQDPMLDEILATTDSSGVVQVAKNRWYTPVNEELESDQSAILLSGLGRKPLSLEFPFEQMAERAHEQGGLVDSEKATSVELPAIAGLSGVDLVGLANNHFWRSDCYTGPWGVWPDHAMQKYQETCEGFARAGFDIYYALLNFGVSAKLSAGSAYGVQPTPLGWSRIYVHVDGKFTADNWFRALKLGHSFVTTGPMILLKVNGLEPGEEDRSGQFPLRVQADLTVLSTDPIANAEIVVNGQPMSVAMSPDENNKYYFHGNTGIALTGSSWIAARYMAPRGNTLALTHTSPIYFWNQSQPIPVTPKDAEYILAKIESLIRETQAGRAENNSDSTSNVFDNEETRQKTLKYLERAKKLYEAKLHH